MLLLLRYTYAAGKIHKACPCSLLMMMNLESKALIECVLTEFFPAVHFPKPAYSSYANQINYFSAPQTKL